MQFPAEIHEKPNTKIAVNDPLAEALKALMYTAAK